MLAIADYIEYIKLKHGDQKRKHGTPYYLHPIAVCKILKSNGFPEDYQIAGLFHDLLEDTDVSYEDLVIISNKEIADAVRLVTKEKGYNMDDYIDRISKNDMAKMVKLADRLHNLLETSLASKAFQIKYINETEKYYLKLAENTIFEEKIKEELFKLKNNN